MWGIGQQARVAPSLARRLSCLALRIMWSAPTMEPRSNCMSMATWSLGRWPDLCASQCHPTRFHDRLAQRRQPRTFQHPGCGALHPRAIAGGNPEPLPVPTDRGFASWQSDQRRLGKALDQRPRQRRRAQRHRILPRRQHQHHRLHRPARRRQGPRHRRPQRDLDQGRPVTPAPTAPTSSWKPPRR